MPDDHQSRIVCCCCGGTETKSVGAYSLPLRTENATDTSLSYPLVECAECGHVMAFPLPDETQVRRYYSGKDFWKSHGVSESFDQRSWREVVVANSSLWERFARARRQLDFIRRDTALHSSANIIDLGAGYSPFLYHCAQDGYRNLHALEPSASICSFLGRQNVTTYDCFLEEFITRTDLPHFDLMMLSHTVEHLARPDQILEGLRNRLSPSGALFIDVPFQDHLRPFHQGLHFQFFNPTSMVRLLKRCGFDVVTVTADRFNLMERALLGVLYAAYGRLMHRRGGLAPSTRIEMLHRLGWRPLKKCLGLRINVFISSSDVRVVARRA